jgi:hypothetical protein
VLDFYILVDRNVAGASLLYFSVTGMWQVLVILYILDDRNITDILLKVALNTLVLNIIQVIITCIFQRREIIY